jgi:hypothetical protein
VARKALIFAMACAAWAGCVGDIGDAPVAPGVSPSDAVGPSVIPRLNRSEYRNTIRDLLGTSLDPSASFPADDVSFGFDNIAQVLSISPLMVELYEQSAQALAKEALAVPTTSTSQHVEAETLTGSTGAASGGAYNLYSNGEVGQSFELSGDGDYTIRARVWGQQAGPDLVQAAIVVDGVQREVFVVAADQNAPELIEHTAALTPGNHQIGVAFLNDYYQAPDDRNLYVDWISVEGPLGQIGKNPAREKIVFCDPNELVCRRDILERFASRAYRRAVTAAEVDAMLGLVQLAIDEGGSVDDGLEVALSAMLLSPHFVFRPELDDDPTSEVPHPLSDYELASRLSYFLWSSMPDDALFEAAASGDLNTDERLVAEVARMLADPKAQALIDNFAGQWLLVRALDDHVPDYSIFASYDETLRASYKKELELFFGDFLSGEIGLDEILTAEFTYLNDRLAQQYGLPFDGGAELQRVSLEGSDQRFGLLTMGGLLTVTSYPNRTSPVKRGVWILEQLLCSGPPPPPAGVEGLVAEETPTGSLRERMEAHRADPVCASCHVLMDPLGLGLEHYDGIGAHRTEEFGGFAIDASGELATGEAFTTAREMAELLQSDARFSACLVEKMFTYALGRGASKEDEVHLEHIQHQLAAGGYKLPDLIKLLVTSKPFRTRRGTKEAS